MKLLDREFIRASYPGLSKYFVGLSRILFGGGSQQSSKPWHNVFLKSYFLYKKWWEDSFQNFVHNYPQVFKKGHVLDVGACIGYTAQVFSQALDPDYRVYAFEPEPSNHRILNKFVKTQKLSDLIHVIPDAVGATSGDIQIWRNPIHHADHRVATQTLLNHAPNPKDLVTAHQWSLDDFCESRGILDKIAFVKIDVQGYEVEVLKGLSRILAANRNISVAVEYAPAYFHILGENEEHFFEIVRNYGFKIYILNHKGVLSPMDRTRLDQMVAKRGYVDLLLSFQAL